MMPFFSLHGLSEQARNYILAAIIFEGKELGFNSFRGCRRSHIARAIRNGANSGKNQIRVLDTSGAYPNKSVLHAVRLG